MLSRVAERHAGRYRATPDRESATRDFYPPEAGGLIHPGGQVDTMKQASKSDKIGVVNRRPIFEERRLAMLYVGLDVHAKQSTYCI